VGSNLKLGCVPTEEVISGEVVAALNVSRKAWLGRAPAVLLLRSCASSVAGATGRAVEQGVSR
jgi:hypothetical protein